MQRGQSGQYPLCGRRRDGERRSTLSKSREEFSMPIRFRCAYCNQLLGIARRKAGTVVRCPTCAGQVVVPNVETNEPEGEPGEEKQLIFERSDFDELLNTEGIDAATGQMKPKLMTSSEEPIVVTSAMAPPGKTIQADPSYDVKPALSSPAPPMAQPHAAQDA